jgi:hypothetical protein
MNTPPKSKWSWRLWRRGLIGLAGLATLAAVLITEENWRGQHDWQAYRRAAEARGERFDLASVIPPAVPDDQNFFAAPIVAEALKSVLNGDHGVNRMEFNLDRGDSANWPTNGGNWEKGRLTDLKQWQSYFRQYSQTPEGQTNGFPIAAQPQTPAADILLALSAFNPALDELRQASLRPYARMPLKYENGFAVVGELLPWLANEKRCAQLLQLRILAELEAGQSQPALEDEKLLFRVINSIRDQPFLIAHLVRIAMQHIALQPIYEGLAQHRWNDAQLDELGAALTKQDFLADFKSAMRGERTCAIEGFETQRLTREMKADIGDSKAQTVTNSLRWMPSAFFYQNELAFARMYEQWVLALVDLTNRTVSVAGFHTVEADSKAHMKHYSPYTVQALRLFPAVGKSVIKFATIQEDVDLAGVACALERYRLAHGSYPETLAALAPQFIAGVPHDLINGQPLHYRRTEDTAAQSSNVADGKFVLYSVGWNEIDDGGVVVLTKSGRVDLEKGDWVWKY